MNRPEKTHRPVRVALAHLFATGAHRPGTTHGLLHLGLLPLEAGAEVQQWLFNPERDNSRAVTEASGVSNDRAKSSPMWAESAPMVQAALLEFDALLIMDRAGVPSPERHWLEHHIMAGMDRPPVCVGLDELLAFFQPAEVLDDADELLKKLVVRDKTWSEKLGYAKRNAEGAVPQLPFVLHAMRRAVRQLLASVLRQEGEEPHQWQPGYVFLATAVQFSPHNRELRAFRLLVALAQLPGCCDEEITQKPDPKLELLPQSHAAAPGKEQVGQLLHQYLARWRDRIDDTGAPELGLGDVSEQQVEAAFEDLGKRLSGATRDSKEKFQPRPQQVAYAQFVGRAIGGRGPYAIEAGTGTGKTYGYLVPALEYLRHTPNALVVVATSTKNLQEQMRRGELPNLLREPDGRRNPHYQAVRTATLKGKNGYLCVEALGEEYGDCYHPKARWVDALAWLYLALRLRDTEGEVEGIARSLSEHPQLGPVLRGLLRRVTADRACRHGPLPGRKPCVYPAHRIRAEEANLLIVNHHKLALLSPKALERATVCIIDEADRFPDNFRSALACSLNARELQEELLDPLLKGTALVYGNRGRTDTDNATALATERRTEPFLQQLLVRLGEAEDELWRQVPEAERPDHTVASRAAYEAVEEARLADLGSRAAFLEEIAELLRDTPLAADARQTADAAWAHLASESMPFRQRQAVRTARQCILESKEPLEESLLALSELNSRFQRPAGRPGAWPFPPGETHWQDNVRIERPKQRPVYRSLHWELIESLPALNHPLKDVAAQLGRLRRHLGQALNIGASDSDARAENDSTQQSPDQRLWRRTERFAELAQSQAEVLDRLLAEFPCRAYVPVVERDATGGALGWQLVRQPYDLGSYLGPLLDAVTGKPLALEPDETPENYSRRVLAARAALRRLSGEPSIALLEQFRSVIFTSATLYVEGGLHYFRQLLDLRVAFAAEQRIQPLFDYNDEKAEAVLGGVPAYLPKFSAGAHPDEKTAWTHAQLRALLPLLVALEGRTLVLFTSNEDMLVAAHWLRDRLAAFDIELLTQNGASDWEIRRFRQVEQSVLLGVDRMWTGVDFAGPTLSQVIVWRLPFPSLGVPLISHRKRYEPDEVFWAGFYRPAARLKLRQGFGRLVRRQRDRGAFIVLDARIASAFYASILDELEVEAFHQFDSPTALLAQTAGPLLKLLQLGEDFRRRGLSLERLVEISQDQ